jgi:hypothetical protein
VAAGKAEEGEGIRVVVAPAAISSSNLDSLKEQRKTIVRIRIRYPISDVAGGGGMGAIAPPRFGKKIKIRKNKKNHNLFVKM